MSRWAWLLGLLAVMPASAQQIRVYTHQTSSATEIALGYPVPQPVQSLTPVDGFRDYASLDARLQSLDADSHVLAGHVVGQTHAGRSVRAYVVSTADVSDQEGRSKPAFFINATTHAREWAAPEVSTYLIERMVAGAGDGGLVDYLLRNTRLVIIPVQNVDGFLQTQRYPNAVIIGQDPRAPTVWPRDGRMRRKNMLGVDEVLNTFADHLGGVDLNRNHPPFWGTTLLGGTLANPRDLTFRGSGAHSEPESQALRAAAELGPPSRYRLGVDIHSHSRVFFSSNTSRERLNAIQSRLIGVIARHHQAVPTALGRPNGAPYSDVPDPPNSGIGAAAEYFAYEWLVPAWTLELEPVSSGAEYGGFGVSHSGFILPNSEVRRVREAWAESFLTTFYFMAGPPHLREVRVIDRATDDLLQQRRWLWDSETGSRRLRVERNLTALAGQPLRVELRFSKPMRHSSNPGEVIQWPGSNIPLLPIVRLSQADGGGVIDVSSGRWSDDEYRNSTFSFDFTPAADFSGELTVEATDMVGLALDADPATAADWESGAWHHWEGDDGSAGDIGGADRLTAQIDVLTTVAPTGVSLAALPTVIGEGDRLHLRLQRSSTAGAVELEAVVGAGNAQRIGWADGESGERQLTFAIADDFDAQGDRDLSYRLEARVVEGRQLVAEGSLRLLDNDRPNQPVVRIHPGLDAAALPRRKGVGRHELVLDGAQDYTFAESSSIIPGPPCQALVFEAPVRVFGNRARLRSEGACGVSSALGAGSVELRDLLFVVEPEDGAALSPGLLSAADRLELHRVEFIGGSQPQLDAAASVVTLRRSSFRASQRSTVVAAALTARQLQMETSSVFEHPNRSQSAAADTALLRLQQPSSIANSTLYRVPVDFFRPASEQATLTVAGSAVAEHAEGLDLPPLTPACVGVIDQGFNLYQSASAAACAFTNQAALELGAPVPPVNNHFLPNSAMIDAGGDDCGLVDQRGAPRPQTLSADATPRCDIGAIEAGINPWRGLWIPARPGHGIDMQTVGNVLFLLWYTYADDGTPTAYQAAAPLIGPRWQAELLLAQRQADGSIDNRSVGQVAIEFDSDVAATLRWRFDSVGADGSEAISAYAFATDEPRVEVTGTWYPPTDGGWGASITRRGEVTAMALYYYDAGGRLRWALGQGDGADAMEFELASFTGFCPDCDAESMPVRFDANGSARLHFLTPERLRLDLDLSYPGTEGGTWTRQAADLVPLNDPVDNRAMQAQLGR